MPSRTGSSPQLKTVIPDWTDDPINTQSGASNSLYGNAGADAFQARAGHDIMLGGGGADRLRAGAGDDIVDGGQGFDWLWGSLGDDLVSGGDGRDRLYGGSGADSLSGESHGDWLAGGAGDDLLDGGDRDDALFGRAGDDTLIGGRGIDALIGGAGDDVFALQALPGYDVIHDFGAGDQLGLTGGLTETDLTFAEGLKGTQVMAGGEIIAVVFGLSPADVAATDFVIL